ncbi:hypothetical protein [Leyella stercorea]|uniref:hypothetical protein n=1 Tax=Leyella stercorea TaxID=363265 RepID=UPI002430BB76|nr:hypothetical protein [Leyella stercorea]
MVRMSASVGADVRVGRCGRLRRSMRMSASVGADVCVGRCGCLRRSMRMTHIAQTQIKKPRFPSRSEVTPKSWTGY